MSVFSTPAAASKNYATVKTHIRRPRFTATRRRFPVRSPPHASSRARRCRITTLLIATRLWSASGNSHSRPTSAFGGIIAFNQTLQSRTARAIIDKQFVEVIVAPDIEKDALEILAEKKNVRVLQTGSKAHADDAGFDFKKVSGGLLVQSKDKGVITAADLKVVTDKAPDDAQIQDLLFAWQVAKFVKSNAIVFCKDGMTIGVGAGQMSRVYSTKIAAIKAADEGLTVKGSVMASDAFFPFRDGIDSAAEHGISAIIQPGGSMRDEEVIAAANEHGLAMVFTGMRHFRH